MGEVLGWLWENIVELSLIVALIAVTAIAAMQTLGNEFGATLGTVSTTMSNANV